MSVEEDLQQKINQLEAKIASQNKTIKKLKSVRDDNKTILEAVDNLHPLSNDNCFVIYEYGPDGLFIHVNLPEGIDCNVFSELLFNINQGNLRSETMNTILQILPKEVAERVCDGWGALEIQNQAIQASIDNSRPLVDPTEFFRVNQGGAP